MTLKKGFLKPENNFNLTKRQLIRGIALGIAFAIPLYIFWFTLFEVFRTLSSYLLNGLYIFTAAEMAFFKWFYAAIAILTGHHICLLFWASRIRRTYQMPFRLKIRLSNIVNDISSSLAVFVHWFVKCVFLYGMLLYVFCCNSMYGPINFYEDYTYFFIILLVWLWLSSWINIWRTFRTRAYKWMVLSAVLVVSSSFILSQWDAIDYKAINQSYSDSHPLSEYSFLLPHSEIAEKLEKKSRVLQFFVGYNKISKSQDPDIIFKNRKIKIDSFAHTITELLQQKEEREIPYVTVFLVADQRIPMQYIQRLKKEITRAGIFKIAFGTRPTKALVELRTPPNFYIGANQYLQPSDTTDYLLAALRHIPPTPPEIRIDCHSNEIKIEVPTAGFILLNGSLVAKNELSKQIEKEIARDADYVITLTKNTTMTLGEYLFLYNAPQRAIKDLRNKLSYKKYGKHFRKLSIAQRNEYSYLLRYKWVEKK